jgi:hypothetical protein
MLLIVVCVKIVMGWGAFPPRPGVKRLATRTCCVLSFFLYWGGGGERGGVENCFLGIASFGIASFEIASFEIASFEIASFGTKGSNCFLCRRLASVEYRILLIK